MQDGSLDFRNLNYSSEELALYFKEERNRARMHSFSEVSELVLHDLTNPLAVARFCVEQLEINPDLVKEKPQYLEKIKYNLDRAFEIIASFKTIVRDVSHQHFCRFDASHNAVVKLIQAQYKDAQKELTVILDSSLEGVLVRIPQFDTVFILDTIYRILLSNTPLESGTILKVKKESLSNDKVFLKISSNSKSISTIEVKGLLNLFNLRVISQQLINYGGHVGSVDKSLTECAGTNLRIGLPLEVGE